MMYTANFPRAVIQGLNDNSFPFEVTDLDWLVSITDFGNADVVVEKPFGRVLYVRFDDVVDPSDRSITADQAASIAAFLLDARDAGANVWVNCHAGTCRSGAVSTLAADLGWERKHHYLSPKAIPNTLVYNAIRRYFPEMCQSWDEVPDPHSLSRHRLRR